MLTATVYAKSAPSHPSAAQQFVTVSNAANSAPFVQSKVSQAETIRFQGQTIKVNIEMGMRVQHVKKNIEALATVSMKSPGGNLHQTVFINQGKEYISDGSGWQYAGAIKVTNLQQLTQMSGMVYRSVKVKAAKASETFTATVNPNTFASLVEQALSAFTPASSSSQMPKGMTKVLAEVFKDTKVSLVATAVKAGGVERMSKEKVSMSVTITPKELGEFSQSASTSTGGKTVTTSVYGSASGGASTQPELPKTPIQITAIENATFAYAHLSITQPKGLPKH